MRLKNAITMPQLASYNASRSGREEACDVDWQSAYPRHKTGLTCFCAIEIGEAVVLCCAIKDQISGNWRVQETGVRSDGNAKLAWRRGERLGKLSVGPKAEAILNESLAMLRKMYGPLHTTVRQLVLPPAANVSRISAAIQDSMMQRTLCSTKVLGGKV